MGDRGSGQDDDVARSVGAGAAQRHCRMFNVPDSMDTRHDVARQAHRHPWDHNNVGNRSWQYDDARQEVRDFWDDEGCTQSAIDTDERNLFNSFDGVIYRIDC